MPTEEIVVTVDGEPHPYVKSLSIALSAEQGVRSASILTAEPDGRFWTPPGAAIVIRASGDLVLTGHVRDYDPDCTKATREVRVEVESKTCDAAEGGSTHKTGRVEKKTLDKAASELGEGYGSRFKAEGELSPIPEVVYHPGETLFATVERYARGQGLFVTDDEHGDQVLFGGIRGRHAGVLAFPGNVLHCGAKLSERTRKSERRVRGQGARGKGAKVLRSEGRIRDPGVTRHRPQIIVHEGDADAQRLRERARYDQARANGFAINASPVLASWRDEAGKIWTPAFVIPLDAWDMLRIAQDMAIVSARLTWAKDGGTLAALELRDPKSFASQKGGKGGKSSKSAGTSTSKTSSTGADRADPAWSYGDEDATVEVEE